MRSTSIFIIATGVIILSRSPVALNAQCEFGWSNPVQFDYPGPKPGAAIEFDEDGNGPNAPLTLFSGYVQNLCGREAGIIAAWDGTYWRPFPAPDNSNTVIAQMFAHDEDGPGPLAPALWISGSFSSISGIAAAGIARYDHGAWHGTADGIAQFPYGGIKRFVSGDPDGDGPIPARLCAVGSLYLGPLPSPQQTVIAEFFDSSWHPLGENSPPEFTTISIIFADADGSEPSVPTYFRTGAFWGQSSGEVQRWSGIEWQRVGNVFDRAPSTIVLFDPDQGGPREAELYVGGSFTVVGPQSARGIARWRDNQWQPLEIELLGAPTVSASLAVGDDDGDGPRRNSLFVSGNFIVPGAPIATRDDFGRWDGQSWEGLGSSSVFGLPFSGNMLERGNRVFKWFSLGSDGLLVRDQQGWRHVVDTPMPFIGRALAAVDLDGPGPENKSLVTIGNQLDLIDDNVSKNTASWDGRRWRGLSSNNLAGTIKSLEVFDFDGDGSMPPRLVAAGSLNFGGTNYAVSVQADGVWQPMTNTRLAAGEYGNRLVVYDTDGDGPSGPALLLGGTFSSLDGNFLLRALVRWTPAGWLMVENSLAGFVNDMLIQDDDGPGPARPALYVAGPSSVTLVAMHGIARFDGSQWRPLVDVVTGNVETPSPVNALCSLEEEPGRFTLCAGGNFLSQTGLIRAARWKGGHWLPMGIGLPGAVTVMAARNDVTGSGSDAYCLASNKLYRWTGQDWVHLLVTGGNVYSMASIDFDAGGPQAPQMVVGGWFNTVKFESGESMIAPGLATYGPRQPFYFATPWDRSIAAGERLSLKVATGGPEPMTFAWTRDGVTLNDGGADSGATTRELVIDPVGSGDGGLYECIATNACGSIPSGPTLVRVCATLANGDLNSDGQINGLDIATFVEVWTTASLPESDCAVDLTHNGVRDPDDIAWFIGRLLSP